MKVSFFDISARQKFFDHHGIKSFRIKQIEHEIFHNSVLDFDAMTSLPKDLRALLCNMFEIIPFDVDVMYDGDDSCKI